MFGWPGDALVYGWVGEGVRGVYGPGSAETRLKSVSCGPGWCGAACKCR
jgi:hypothetical protein